MSHMYPKAEVCNDTLRLAHQEVRVQSSPRPIRHYHPQNYHITPHIKKKPPRATTTPPSMAAAWAVCTAPPALTTVAAGALVVALDGCPFAAATVVTVVAMVVAELAFAVEPEPDAAAGWALEFEPGAADADAGLEVVVPTIDGAAGAGGGALAGTVVV
jgi:hypothetical protein